MPCCHGTSSDGTNDESKKTEGQGPSVFYCTLQDGVYRQLTVHSLNTDLVRGGYTGRRQRHNTSTERVLVVVPLTGF